MLFIVFGEWQMCTNNMTNKCLEETDMEKYEEMILEIITFHEEDIIVTSGGDDSTDDENF